LTVEAVKQGSNGFSKPARDLVQPSSGLKELAQTIRSKRGWEHFDGSRPAVHGPP